MDYIVNKNGTQILIEADPRRDEEADCGTIQGYSERKKDLSGAGSKCCRYGEAGCFQIREREV